MQIRKTCRCARYTRRGSVDLGGRLAPSPRINGSMAAGPEAPFEGAYLRVQGREPCPYLSPLKNALISAASASGCSIAAKWPPFGITVHRRMLL
ncbi:MAG: hypothetical protein QOF90_421 [Acetobacteraceae bacterium]|jgi:hypothetical protein|nr:hypothetical protein [Acetobacteraceae bacterium]